MSGKDSTVHRLRDMFLTGASGIIAGGSFSHFNGYEFSDGGQVGLSLTMTAWTYLIIQDNWPKSRYRTANAIISSSGRPVLVNGTKTFLNTIGWREPKQRRAQGRLPFMVNHPEQDNIPLHETDVFLFLTQGWARQQRGDPAPFAKSRYQIKPRRKLETLYRFVGEMNCFTHYGQGVRSKLRFPPQRAMRVIRYTYDDMVA